MSTGVRSFFRELIVGNDPFILSHFRYKRILLTGQLCIITVCICIAYFFLDFFGSAPGEWMYEGSCAIAALISFILNRHRRFDAARILLALSANATVFIFASTKPLEEGLYLYFLTNSLAAFAIFGFEDRRMAIFFVLLSTGLFALSLGLNNNVPAHTVDYRQHLLINVIINFAGSSTASVCIIYFLISVNYHSESLLQKHEKETLDKNAILTQLNTELDRFVYSTSHDLRAPLASLLGLARLSELTDDSAELKTYISMMQVRIGHLEKFIKDIADLARNARAEVDSALVAVKPMIMNVVETLRYQPGAAEVHVEVDVPDDLHIMSDPLRLQMVLGNIIGNAFRYCDPEKERKHIVVRAGCDRTNAVITISDNGVGIPDTHREKIFEMYVRASEHSEGSGLGLYIVKESLSKLQGTIHVESKIREGSTFSVTIPLERSHPAE